MKFKFLLIAVICIAMAGCGGKNNNTTPTYKMNFGTPSAFNLGETQQIKYAFSDAEPKDIALTNIPAGWEAKLDKDKKVLTVTCGKSAGISGDYTITVMLTDENGNQTQQFLTVKSDISTGTLYYINGEKTGVVIKPKTSSTKGLILHKTLSIVDVESDFSMDWAESKAWCEGKEPKGEWSLPTVAQLQTIYHIWTENRSLIDDQMNAIGKNVFTENNVFWSSEEDKASALPDKNYYYYYYVSMYDGAIRSYLYIYGMSALSVTEF